VTTFWVQLGPMRDPVRGLGPPFELLGGRFCKIHPDRGVFCPGIAIPLWNKLKLAHLEGPGTPFGGSQMGCWHPNPANVGVLSHRYCVIGVKKLQIY